MSLRAISLLLLAASAALAVPAPTCNAGTTSTVGNVFIGKTFRAGFAATLDGSGSVSGDGTSLKYQWQQIPSTVTGVAVQANATWSSYTVSQPVVTGLVAGPFDVQLTVTQGDAQKTTCTVHNGVVATDANNTVLFPATALGNAAQITIGNPVAYQKNPWPWYDTANGDALLELAGNYDLNSTGSPVNYQTAWNTSAAGTITSVAVGGGNSLTITGSGTDFQNQFCGGGTSPTGNTFFILWYLTGRTNPDTTAETGRMNPSINTCTSATSMSVSLHDSPESFGYAWPTWLASTGVLPLASQTGLHYSVVANGGCGTNSGACWWAAGAPPYYDPIQAFYAAYYRSGIDYYLAWARTMADRMWTWPGVDRGVAFATSTYAACANQTACIQLDMGGLMLRALDTGDSHLDMFQGLQHLYFWNAYQQNYAFPLNGTDPRLAGAGLMAISYAALLDQSGTNYSTSWCPNCSTFYNIGTVSWVQFARNSVHWTMCQSSTGCHPSGYTFYKSWRDPIQGAWLQWYGSRSSYDTSQAWSGQLASVTHNSTIVTCPNCGWLATDFTNKFDQNNGGAVCTSGTYCVPGTLTLCAGPTFSQNSSICDTRSYCTGGGCSWNAATKTLTLDAPYAGATGSANWSLATWTDGTVSHNQGFVVTAFGQDTFLEGIQGAGFQVASLACAGAPAGCGASDSAIAQGYFVDTGNWLQNYSLAPSYFAVSYLAGYPACVNGQTPPISISTSNIACLTNLYNVAAREIMTDASRDLVANYALSHSSGLKAILDNWYAGMWAKPGTSPLIASPDTAYDINFDADRSQCTLSNTFPNFQCDGTGYGFWINTIGNPGFVTPFLSQKLTSQNFGVSNQAAWPSVRIGGPLPTSNVTVSVQASIAGVTSAAKFSVTVTDPTGLVHTPVVCNASPCSITVDKTGGNYLFQISYLNSGGSTLAQASPYVVTVN